MFNIKHNSVLANIFGAGIPINAVFHRKRWGKKMLKVFKTKNGREYQLHATKGWKIQPRKRTV